MLQCATQLVRDRQWRAAGDVISRAESLLPNVPAPLNHVFALYYLKGSSLYLSLFFFFNLFLAIYLSAVSAMFVRPLSNSSTQDEYSSRSM
jgi:hypothetical protein